MSIIITNFVVILIFNLLVYCIAYFAQTDKLTDITYSFCFFSLAIYLMVRSQNQLNVNQFIIAGMVMLWALRLGSYLFIRIST